MASKIFITGITGCVGHYLYDLLADDPDYDIYVLTKKSHKLVRRDINKVTLIKDELANISKHAQTLKQMDYVIHAAAGWGVSEPNYEYSKTLFESLDPHRVKKIIYFSTASILDSNNRPNPMLEKIGTGYITSKFKMFKELPKLKVYNKIITVFPTWVLGGDNIHPYSHAMTGIIGATKWLWLLRFFTLDLSFHFIHAQDIASIVDYLLKNDSKQNELVLGNPLISAGQLIKEMCAYYNKKIYGQIKITPEFVKAMVSIFGKNLSAWDRYCLEKGKFEHRVVNAKTFSLSSENDTIAGVLRNVEKVK